MIIMLHSRPGKVVNFETGDQRVSRFTEVTKYHLEVVTVTYLALPSLSEQCIELMTLPFYVK